MISEETFEHIAERIFGFSNADETEVILSATDGAITRFSNNVITQNVAQKNSVVTIRAITGKRAGRATTNKFDDDSLKAIVDAAQRMARCQKRDLELLPLIGSQSYRPVQTHVGETALMGPKERAVCIAFLAEGCRRKKFQAAGIFSNGEEAVGLANSKGVFAFQKLTGATFSATVTAGDGSGWAEGTDKDVNQIDVPRLSKTALEKAEKSQGPRDIKPGDYTVVLEPAAVAEFLLFMAWEAFGGLNFVEGRSCFSDRFGEKLFDEKITIVDDAYNPLNPGLAFDFEGLPRQPVVLVEKGTARGVVHDRITGQKAGMDSTGHALPQPNTMGPIPLNLVLSAGTSSLEEMIASTDKGILVTHFHYTNVIDPKKMVLTGMTRDGTFWIKHGEIAYPLKNLRFTESVLKALGRVELISRERVFTSAFFGGGFVVPAMKISQFTFSSTTEF